MIKDLPTVRLELESRPESLTVARGALAGMGEQLAFEPELLDDLKTAVSEACNNVVMHAYGGRPGPLSIELTVGRDRVQAVVRDRGSGIHGVASAADRIGIGLALISSLAERAEFLSRPEGGTEVRMSFTGRIGRPPEALESGASDEADWPAAVRGDTIVKLFPKTLLGGVLGRTLRATAAGAHFSVDRFSDLYLIEDELTGYAKAAAKGERMAFGLDAANKSLALMVGPFQSGSYDRLAGDDAAEAPLILLADELSSEASDQSEMLLLVVRDHRAHTNGNALADIPTIDQARDFVVDAYRSRLRRAGHTAEHPIAVARLLQDDQQSRVVILGGMLHDVLEDTFVTPEELRARFGGDVTRLVQALTQDPTIDRHEQRKAALRQQVLNAGPDAGTVALADKTAKLQRAEERPPDRRLEHYRATLTGIEQRYGRSKLSELLRAELGRWSGGLSGSGELGLSEAQ